MSRWWKWERRFGVRTVGKPRMVCMFCGRIYHEGTLPASHGVCPDDENRSEACRERQREEERKAKEGRHVPHKGEED